MERVDGEGESGLRTLLGTWTMSDAHVLLAIERSHRIPRTAALCVRLGTLLGGSATLSNAELAD